VGALLSSIAEPLAPPPDNPTAEESVSETIKIKHENAADIAAALKGLTVQYRGIGTNPLATKRGAANALSNASVNVSLRFKESNSPTEADVRSNPKQVFRSGQQPINADNLSNSLLLYVPKNDLAILKETIAKLDEAREGILVEAVIFEVTLKGTNTVESFCFADPGRQPETTHSTSNESSTNAFAVLGMKEINLNEMITRMADHPEVRILQRPRIQTADGIAATLFVGDSRYCSKTAKDATPVARDTDYHSLNELLGVTLEVSPTITPDRKLSMSIAQTIEKSAGTTNIANFGDVPITSRQSLQTDLTVPDRQTIILAGPIESTQDKASKGVPLLKNTPLIGGLFRNHPHKIKVETFLALRATILPQQQARTSGESAR
jgi:general secretion pathway protein D